MEDIVAKGFPFLAMARPFILEPDLVRKLETGAAVEARCVPCNKCLAAVNTGPVRCVLRDGADSEGVGP